MVINMKQYKISIKPELDLKELYSQLESIKNTPIMLENIIAGNMQSNRHKENKQLDKVSIHKKICENLNKIYEAKNHDYGDSFARVRAQYPQSINIRLWDKLLRLDQLNNGVEAKVQDEKIEDTLLDMANYCIMEVIERYADNPSAAKNVASIYPVSDDPDATFF